MTCLAYTTSARVLMNAVRKRQGPRALKACSINMTQTLIMGGGANVDAAHPDALALSGCYHHAKAGLGL